MPFDVTTVRDALRLIDAEVVSLSEAAGLPASFAKRPDFLRTLLADRRSFDKYPELVAAFKQAAGEKAAMRPASPDESEPHARDFAGSAQLSTGTFYESILTRLDPNEPT